jgi:hypothetical protein
LGNLDLHFKESSFAPFRSDKTDLPCRDDHRHR